MNIPPTNYPRIVIIGGGFGGLQLAKGLEKSKYQVVMLDKNNYHTFQPLLYQVASAGLEPDSIAYPIRKIFKNQNNFFFRMAEVDSVNKESKIVKTNIGQLSYDYLIIATGSDTNYFGMADIEKYAMPMKNVKEALNLRSLLLQNFEKALLAESVEEQESLMTFVIVGAGPTGVELAGALAELKKHVLPTDYPDLDVRRMRIHLIEMADEVLPPMSSPSSKNALKYLEDLGVTVWLNQSVASYDGKTIKFKKAEDLKAHTLIWAAGVKGQLLNGIGEEYLERGRYKVDEFNKIVGLSAEYAIGDVSFQTSESDPQGLPGVAQVAIQQGRHLAKNFKATLRQKDWTVFEYNDLGTMATVGRNKAVVDLKHAKFKGWFAWIIWMFIHLISLVGFRNKMITFFNWSYNYFNFDKGVRLIIRRYER